MINFFRYKFIYLVLSAVVIVAGLLSVATYGFRYSIDFVGGSNLEYELSKPVKKSMIEDVFKRNGVEVSRLEVQDRVVDVRAKAIDEKKESALVTDLEKTGKVTVQILRSETVGPVLGRETLIKTLIASGIAVLAILLYMSFAFKSLNFAIAAIVALVHDLLVVVGTYSLMSRFFGAELDTMFVTALLTAMSFSVHDTIVIFDKIREYKREEGVTNIERSANKALTETLVRSLNNSMTIIFMLLALTLLGGETIRFFVATLLIGTITGTYSSPFVATPVLVWLERRRK